MKLLKGIFKFFLFLFSIVATLSIIAFACAYYAFEIEPYRLTVNTIDIDIVGSSNNHFTIVQFSDTHIKDDFTAEDFSKVVGKINELSPDFVVFTGDLYDKYSSDQDDRAVIDELSRISAKIAKIAIRGNRDYGGGAVNYYEDIMISGGFDVIIDQSKVYETTSGKRVLFTGLDDSLFTNPKMPQDDYQEIDFAVFMSHEPDVVENYPIQDYNLILCGHTHGGQIDIPFLPFINEYALEATLLASKYPSGLSVFEEGKQYLYVNTGIGTTKISARFNVVPEISQFIVTV